MNKLSKRAISILIIATFMLSMIPIIPAHAIAVDNLYEKDGTTTKIDGDKGDIVVVKGTGVTSGAVVNVYFDYVNTAGLMNNTEANPDGTFEVWFKIPEALAGNHYVWVKDLATGDTIMYDMIPAFQVLSLVKLSPSSGLKGDEIDVKGYGFGEEKLVSIVIDTFTVTDEAVGTGTGSQTVFPLDHVPVEADSQLIYVDGALKLETIDYTFVDLTGEITFLVAPDVGLPVTATYTTADVYTIDPGTTFKTDEFGSFAKTFDVPDYPYGVGVYTITALDEDINTFTADFTIGASISVTPEEGPTGTVVTVDGRGWTNGATMTFQLEGSPIEVVGGGVITVVGGKFSADVVIRGMTSKGTYALKAIESLTLPDATIDFEVTGIPEIVVSPTYGSPGATITVTGSNFTQKAGTEVVIELWSKGTDLPIENRADLVIAETESDGTFEETFTSPAVKFIGYDVRAYEDVYHMYAEDPFKVGLIAMIINPTYGSAGTEVSLTGIGFKGPGVYNLTFGDNLYEEYGNGVTGGEAISDIFYIPNVELGTYDVTVVDEDENELSTIFTVTAVTEVKIDPAMAPNDYNVSVKGYNFADKADTVDCILYNATHEWEIAVLTDPGEIAAATDDDGNFTAYWEVLPEADLSIGDYTINVTGYDDFLIQVPFSVVEARVDVAPRKALFDRGDTIQFNVKNDFDFDKSYMRIWDPYDNLYWQTELFKDWVKAAGLYTVPYYLQTSGMNPMELTQDAI